VFPNIAQKIILDKTFNLLQLLAVYFLVNRQKLFRIPFVLADVAIFRLASRAAVHYSILTKKKYCGCLGIFQSGQSIRRENSR
jgi:hypothetical protein